MIEIDDAGTGCMIGTPIIVGLKDGIVLSREIYSSAGKSALPETLDIILCMNVDKHEEIRLCRGRIFNSAAKELMNRGFTNVRRVEIQGKLQDLAENLFMEQLYNLGLSRGVVLKGKDYKELNSDIFDCIVIRNGLVKYVREHYKDTKVYKKLLERIEEVQKSICEQF